MLTDLQERAARLMAAYHGLSKAEVARRLGCSRRSVWLWSEKPEFMNRVRELRATIKSNIHSMVEGLTARERKELLTRLKEQAGTHVPELQTIEELLITEEPDVLLVEGTIASLRKLIAGEDAPAVQLADVERLERELDRIAPKWRETAPVMSGRETYDEEESLDEDEEDEALDDFLDDQRYSDEWEDDDSDAGNPKDESGGDDGDW